MKRICFAGLVATLLSVMFIVAGAVPTHAARKADAEAAAAQVLAAARLANAYFMQEWPDPTVPTFVKRERSSNLWTRAVYYEGLMALYAVCPDQAYLDYTDRWADFHRWTTRKGERTCNADDQCCAQTYLDRYMMTADERMLAHVRVNLEHQMQTHHRWWTWVDAIQMAMPVYSKMYRITADERYLDHAMRMYTWTRDTLAGGLFNKQEGLWWRDKDFVPPYKEADGANCYWSRGCGWAYATLVRVLDDIDSRPMSRQVRAYRERLLADFRSMSQALLACQRADGFWNVSLLSPVTYGGPELTGTTLFLYGMCWGIRTGVLKRSAYLPACQRAWMAARQCVHPNGFLGYVQGTGKEPASAQPVTFNRKPDFEDYGLGCFLLGATAYYSLLSNR